MSYEQRKTFSKSSTTSTTASKGASKMKKDLPPVTHHIKGPEGFVQNVFVREGENDFGTFIKINVPEGKSVTLSEGTYYINKNKPKS